MMQVGFGSPAKSELGINHRAPYRDVLPNIIPPGGTTEKSFFVWCLLATTQIVYLRHVEQRFGQLRPVLRNLEE
jgi:hypothetical protein